MKLLLKILLPVLVLVLCIFAARTVIANRPEPTTRPQFKSSTAIEATRLSPQSYTVTLNTRGEASAGREGSLVAEVAGTITEVSPKFVVGGNFRKGEMLAKVDPRDYEIALTLAEANLAQVRATLAEEQARAEQAALDWRKLGRKGNPPDLTLRKPQLAAARANLEGARGQVQRAQLDLERTLIAAMYDGRISGKEVDLGQYVNKGSSLAQIYSTANAEIRLPFTSTDLRFIDLDDAVARRQPIKLQATVAGSEAVWNATIVRTEGIDPNSRQLFVIARVDNPYSAAEPLRIGQFVEAEVTGKTLDNVFVIPRSALREDRQVLIVDEVGTLQVRDVKVEWKNADVAVISGGLEPGEVLNTTALGSVTNGTRVKATIDGVAPQSEKRGGERGGKPEGGAKSGAKPDGKPASAGNNQNGDERLMRLKSMVDAGEDLPPQVVKRIKTRMEAGEEVPAWLKQHIEKTSK